MQACKQITFNSNGKAFLVRQHDAIMDNGKRISFIDGDFVKLKQPQLKDIIVPPNEWGRIKENFSATSYEDYFGRAPLVSGVTIFKLI